MLEYLGFDQETLDEISEVKQTLVDNIMKASRTFNNSLVFWDIITKYIRFIIDNKLIWIVYSNEDTEINDYLGIAGGVDLHSGTHFRNAITAQIKEVLDRSKDELVFKDNGEIEVKYNK